MSEQNVNLLNFAFHRIAHTVRAFLAHRKYMLADLPRKLKGSRLVTSQSSVCVGVRVYACPSLTSEL